MKHKLPVDNKQAIVQHILKNTEASRDTVQGKKVLDYMYANQNEPAALPEPTFKSKYFPNVCPSLFVPHTTVYNPPIRYQHKLRGNRKEDQGI